MINRNYFFQKKTLVGDKCYGYELKGAETINIDTIEDLKNFKLINNKKK
jgi:CMP-N-acetylneuraminic acid synthetase